MRALGMAIPEGYRLPAALDGAGGEVFEVRPDCWDAVQAFALSGTQWRFVTLGGGLAPQRVVRTGLDYAAVGEVIRLEGLDARIADVRLVEAAALQALSDAK